jgi:hypothetical protein
VTRHRRVCATVQEIESIYTHTYICRAQEAYEFLKCSGYPSPNEAIHLFQDSNIYFGLPQLTAEDIFRAYDVYGLPLPYYVRGKLTQKSIPHAIIHFTVIMREKVQVLHTDVMHIDVNKFLITVVEPLQLTTQAHVENETADQLGLDLQVDLNILRTRRFQPTLIHVDPKLAFRSLKNFFPGVVINDGGLTMHQR